MSNFCGSGRAAAQGGNPWSVLLFSATVHQRMRSSIATLGGCSAGSRPPIEASEVSDRFTLELGKFSAVLLGQTSCLFRADGGDKPVLRNGKGVEARLYIGIPVSPKTLVDCAVLLLETGKRVSHRALPRSDGYRTQGEDRRPDVFHQNTTLSLAFNSSFLAA